MFFHRVKYRVQPPSTPQSFLCSPLAGWSWKLGVGAGGQGRCLPLEPPKLDGWGKGGGCCWKSRLGPVLTGPPPNPEYLDRVYFQPLHRCLAWKPAISKHWAATVTCGHQTPSELFLLPPSSFLPLPTPSAPSAAPAVPLKTSCPMAWANMLGHLSCEPVWQDPPLRKAHKTPRPPLSVTQNWWDNKPWSWLSVTF